MAGIGFNLQKILKSDSYSSTLKAHFFSTLIVAGPWLLSIVTLVCLTYFISFRIDILDMIYFRSVIIYIFAFSLVVVGFFHFPLTRYLSDKIYMKEKDSLVPVFITSTIGVLGVQSILAILYFLFVHEPLFVKFLSILIYMTISMIWVLMVFLTALQDYRAITVSYAIGSGIAVMASFFLGKMMGLHGYFLGYLIGHLVIVVMWSARIFVEFPSSRSWDSDFFPFMLQNKVLIMVGLFYNLAIWVDKFVMWMSSQATHVTSFYHSHPIYDSAAFYAFLTIIPSLSIFLIQVETSFYKQYKQFYLGILNKAGYRQIGILKENILKTIRESILTLTSFQGVLTLSIIIFANQISEILEFPSMQIPVFKIMVLGAFAHSFLLMVLIIVLYFDFQMVALTVTALFVATNGILTFITTHMNETFLGYGYFASCAVSLVTAFYLLDYKLKNLEYNTFTAQPVGVHREQEAEEVPSF